MLVTILLSPRPSWSKSYDAIVGRSQWPLTQYLTTNKLIVYLGLDNRPKIQVAGQPVSQMASVLFEQPVFKSSYNLYYIIN